MFIDFKEIKERVTIEDAAKRLGLELKPEGNQLRGPCPTCNSGGDRALVVTPEKGVFFCFSQQKGGDQISLAAHIRKCSFKDAGLFLAEQTAVPAQKAGDKPKKAESKKKVFDPIEYAKSLDAKHELVNQLGLNEELCTMFLMGVATKGVHKGCFTFPIRDEHGIILFFASATGMKLPKNWNHP